MKILSLLFIFCFSFGWSQSGEFNTSKNGLIYSDNAIKQLKHIVDSLNLRFKSCDAKDYYSNLQGRGIYVFVEGKNASEAKKDMRLGMSFASFIKKYPKAKVVRDLLVIRYAYKDYEDNDEVLFQNISLSDKDEYSIMFEKKNALSLKNVRKGWVYNYEEKSRYNKESVSAFFLEGLSSIKLHPKYSRLVQYSQCLIDTNSTVYLKRAKGTGGFFSKYDGKTAEFMKYLDEKLSRPVFNYEELEPDTLAFVPSRGADTTAIVGAEENKYRNYLEEMEAWEKYRLVKFDSLMHHDIKFKNMFDALYKDALAENETTNDEFEEYVSKYISKEQALYLKRNRRVMGGCSMDNSPRIHAMNIAELSAETAKWEVFLRSHLDIMNDRFDRVSDGSYAYAGRKTYIKELEVLDINVTDLLLGISLRIENYPDNHYFGSIGRIGRSLTESRDREAIETSILSMIADNELDELNRVLFYWLFRNYNYSLEDMVLMVKNDARLKEAAAQLPYYLSNSIADKN